MWRFVLVLIPGLAFGQVDQGRANAGFMPEFVNQTRAPELPRSDVEIGVLASGFDFPWGIASLPDGRFLVSERGGTLKVLDDGQVSEVRGLPEIEAIGQGGLLDVAVSPDFARDGLVYLTYSKPVRGGVVLAAAQAVLQGDALIQLQDIFVQTPAVGSGRHFGSRILPDADGIWITTGDRGTPALVQDASTTVGKVMRIEDGRVITWSSGHRNIQGAVLRDGELWTVEHGPRGGDELNQPRAGLNYGWPTVSYGINYNGSDVGGGLAMAGGFEAPVYYWDPVIAPGGMGAYPADGPHEPWRGDLFVSSLNPGGLMRLKIENGRVVGEERLLENVGRVRDVEILGNGDLLVLIDAPDADILRVRPRQ